MDVLRVELPEQLVEEQERPMKNLQWDRVLRALRAVWNIRRVGREREQH